MSNGLPPPESDWSLAFWVAAAALLVDEVICFVPVGAPPPTTVADVSPTLVEGSTAVLGIDSVVVVATGMVEDVLIEVWLDEAEIVAIVVVTCTPGLVVGRVTESVGWCVLVRWIAEEDALEMVDVVFAAVMHKASNIPPFLTIPSNVFELTVTSEHASLTLSATEVSAPSHSDEHPFWKSETAQDGIWLSYVSWQLKGIKIDVICWKLASERASAAGKAVRRRIPRRISKFLSARLARELEEGSLMTLGQPGGRWWIERYCRSDKQSDWLTREPTKCSTEVKRCWAYQNPWRLRRAVLIVKLPTICSVCDRRCER
jgi:hypothetical protein